MDFKNFACTSLLILANLICLIVDYGFAITQSIIDLQIICPFKSAGKPNEPVEIDGRQTDLAANWLLTSKILSTQLFK